MSQPPGFWWRLGMPDDMTSSHPARHHPPARLLLLVFLPCMMMHGGCGQSAIDQPIINQTVDPGSDEFADCHDVLHAHPIDMLAVGVSYKEVRPDWYKRATELLNQRDHYLALAMVEWQRYNSGRPTTLRALHGLGLELCDGKEQVSVFGECDIDTVMDDPGSISFVFEGDQCVDIHVSH